MGHSFVGERALIITTLISSCHWKTILPFCSRKKRPENQNTNSDLLQNLIEKQIMLFKTTVNCLFNDMWSYFIIEIFDWKIGVSQQTVVRGLFDQ